ncbi:DUF6223 family protein [Streptomyces sp. NPDC052676]|uniref:DUF6223 family protein n=1 Tax=Streptomyces sp. NPDC052676 TaxID=3154953 RepID=UPI00342A3829
MWQRGRAPRGSRGGVIALVVGGAVAVTAGGGPGTGNGLGGVCFAMLLGVLALTLGRLAHSRSRSRFGESADGLFKKQQVSGVAWVPGAGAVPVATADRVGMGAY